MEEGGKRRPFAFRVPVSESYWREYGVPLGLLLVALGVVAVVAASEFGDGLVVAVTVISLSVGATLAGLVVYNVVVAALLVRKR
jgi:hypothetical protein